MLQKHSCVCYCACFDVFHNRLNRNAARDISRAVSAHAVGNDRYRFFVFGGYAAIVLIRTSPPRFSSVSINHLTFLVECFVGYSDKHICSLNRFRVCYNKPLRPESNLFLFGFAYQPVLTDMLASELSACTVNIGTQFAPNRCGNMPLFKPLRKFVCICTADPVKAAFLDGIQRNKIHMAIYAAKL